MNFWNSMPGWLKCALIVGAVVMFFPVGLAGAAAIAFLLTPFGLPIWAGAAIVAGIIYALGAKNRKRS